MKFTKVHGLGNDFILVDAIANPLTVDPAELAIKVCDRHLGIGADGLVLILPSTVADVRMRIFNPDGSEPEMCGNVIRCFAKYVFERGIVSQPRINVETLAGIRIPEVRVENGQVTAVRVDMGEPQLKPSQVPVNVTGEQAVAVPLEVNGARVEFTAVSMGNPHCVIFVPEASQAPLTTIGPVMENHQLFPQRTNVEFVQVANRRDVIMRVWERGAGVTMACGTGACAVGVAGVLNGYTDRLITVHLDGGDLEIEWSAENNHVYMTGPAAIVFEGDYFGDR